MAALSASEAQFRVLTESTASAIFVFDGKQFCYANKSLEALTGYTRQELLGMTYLDLIHPGDRGVVESLGGALPQGGDVPSHYEFKILTKSGGERWVDCTASLIDYEGSPAWLGTAFDITERKKAEEIIEYARLHNLATTEQRHLSLLYEVGRDLATTLEPDEILNRAITRTCEALDGLVGQAFLYVPEDEWLKVSAIYSRPGSSLQKSGFRIILRLGEGLAGWVALNRQPANVPDVNADERWWHVPGVDEDVHSAISAPIIAGDSLLGVLSVLHVQAGVFSANHLTLLQAICQEVGLALSNATRYQQAQRQLAEITLIQNLAQTFNRRLELEELLNEVCVQLAERLGYPLVEIFLIEEDALVQRAAYGVTQSNDLIPLDKGIIGRVARTGQVELVQDVRQEPDYIPSFLDTVAELAVPIFHGTVVVGVINIETSLPGRLTAQDRNLLEVLAVQISIALENAVLYRRLMEHAADLEQNVVERNTELTELYELSQEIGYTHSHKDLLQMLVSHLRNALSCDLVVGGLLMSGQRLLIVETNRPLKAACMNALHKSWKEALKGYGLAKDSFEGISMEVVPAKTFTAGDAPMEQIESMISSPIQATDEVVGFLIAAGARQDAFEQAHGRTLETFAHQAAAAVQRLAAMLAAEQKRLEGLVEHLPIGILLLDDEFRLLVANPLGKDILAVLDPDFKGGRLTHLGAQSIADLVARHTDLLPIEIVQPGLARRIFEAQARPASSASAAGAASSAGSGGPSSSAGKDSRQWVLAVREVTQEREYQTRIQMQERLATVGQLAAGIAHDFNNIMAAILVYADLLRDDPDIPAASRERLQIIQNQVQRAASLIRQILDFSHRSVMEQSDLDLLPFMKELDKMLRRVLPETIQLELVYRQDSFMVHADPTRLQQAFMNLALNSRDAMPNGGTLRFEISRILVQPGERPPTAYMFPGLWIRISVQDSGEGISTDNLPHIFEPFFTTKPVGQGTGLGLAQVYGIIKQHDGYIDVKSRVGHGTLFTIFLPALSAPKVKDPTAEFRIQLNGEGKHVLVVEDDPATREALLALLEAHHYGVVAATNGIEALGLLQENHKGVDLIISDIVMPLMGGLSLYRTVNELWPEIKMLFITGHPLEGENQKLLEQGHVMWLQKPFSAQNFNKAVYTLLEE